MKIFLKCCHNAIDLCHIRTAAAQAETKNRKCNACNTKCT